MSDATIVDDIEELDDENLEAEENDGAEAHEGDGDEDGKEGDAEEDEGLAEGGAEPPEKPVSRSERRIRALARERDEARAERDRERTRAEEATRLSTERRQQEDAQAEQQRVSLMSDGERFDYYRAKDRRELEGRIALSEFRAADSQDRSSFESKCARNPALAKIQDEVEEKIAINRRAGGNAARMDVAALVIGQRALKGAPAAATKQRKKAADDKRREQGKPGGGRSDVGASRTKGDSPEARRARLENIVL